jgi:hypothetical protein
MGNPHSIVIIVVLSCKESIGADIAEVSTSSFTGLYLCNISSEGQLGKILGKRASLYGAVLFKLKGTEVKTKGEFYEATNALEKSANFDATLGE